jgi:hypothetical protein
MLLADLPDLIWPGLMMPDTLPVAGNRYGDWLCARVAADDSIVEVIHWYHGGGDWIPWGRTLPEAFVFDSIRSRLPGRRQTHSIRPDASEDISSVEESVTSAMASAVAWSAKWLPPTVTQAVAELSGTQLAEKLIQHHICETAVRCELALNEMDGSVRRHFSASTAAELGIAWDPDGIGWLFDDNRFPKNEPNFIECVAGHDDLVWQDWNRIAEHVSPVCQQRSDLGWPFDIAGWAMERQGNFEAATQLYRRGMFAFAFADQSIRFRTHWFPQWAGKFSTWRLSTLIDTGQIAADKLDPRNTDYLKAIRSGENSQPRQRIFEHWRNLAFEAEAEGRWSDAYDCHYRSGWDLGIDRMGDYREILIGLVRSATNAHQTARAKIAQTHHDCFVARFG